MTRKTARPNEAAGRPITPDERREVEADIHRLIADCEAPKVAMKPNGAAGHTGDPGAFLVKMAEATGSGNPRVQDILARALAKGMGCAEDEAQKPYVDRLNDALALMHAIRPRTPVEGMLAAQMTAAHAMAMRAVDYACWSRDHDVKVNWAKLANKFMATFTQQIEALEKLRGRTGTQTVRVEHVTVQAGGQAIVGAVSPGGEGGWTRNKQNDPMHRGVKPRLAEIAGGVPAERSPSADESAVECTAVVHPGRRRATRTR